VLLNVYARREPASDGTPGRLDVQIYRDAACSVRFVRFAWWRNDKPTRRSKRITLNCWPWALSWAA